MVHKVVTNKTFGLVRGKAKDKADMSCIAILVKPGPLLRSADARITYHGLLHEVRDDLIIEPLGVKRYAHPTIAQGGSFFDGIGIEGLVMIHEQICFIGVQT